MAIRTLLFLVITASFFTKNLLAIERSELPNEMYGMYTIYTYYGNVHVGNVISLTDCCLEIAKLRSDTTVLELSDIKSIEKTNFKSITKKGKIIEDDPYPLGTILVPTAMTIGENRGYQIYSFAPQAGIGIGENWEARLRLLLLVPYEGSIKYRFKSSPNAHTAVGLKLGGFFWSDSVGELNSIMYAVPNVIHTIGNAKSSFNIYLGYLIGSFEGVFVQGPITALGTVQPINKKMKIIADLWATPITLVNQINFRMLSFGIKFPIWTGDYAQVGLILANLRYRNENFLTPWPLPSIRYITEF